MVFFLVIFLLLECDVIFSSHQSRAHPYHYAALSP